MRDRIAKVFKVSDRHVFNALNLEYPETAVVKRIRIAARQNGGVTMATVPAGEAIFFADGTMRADFDNGLLRNSTRADGTGHIFYKGQEVAIYDNVKSP
ncbi:hypothetical protein EZ315_16055 (plasmid) [Duncaniella freteri]|uniref:Uncharacterized protein n=1 Tax=Duncaniella freteri TaxID=2530391 RepID=A0A4Z0V390_9BACT|nr:hypothetical protein [Duncaniella freteri]TGG34871.1 hypothetical protein EZ315_16055 [Duncaniella freteri]